MFKNNVTHRRQLLVNIVSLAVIAYLSTNHVTSATSLEVKTSGSVNIINDEPISYDHFRLPTSVRPEHYKLEILTHLNDEKGFDFYGKVYITVKVIEDTQNITLHVKNLTINDSKIILKYLTFDTDAKKTEIKVLRIETIPKHDYYVLHFEEKLSKGVKYKLYIPFFAELSKGLYGYYRSSYYNKVTNQSEWLSITQFEPHHARSAFPCFDEPDMKAKFHIFLGHNKKYTSLSNMPLKSTKDSKENPEFVWDQFEESVPMSTYLVAYGITNFAFKESHVDTKGRILFRTWARPDAIDQVDYSREIGPRVLKYYEDYFDVKFPLPKVDQIALPDFSAGAMENWGLVTYRETALLYAPESSSSSSKHRVASVVSHELAHQWFGNLVTMKWWSDLWLNEGFATYVASLGVENLHPEWDSLTAESVENTLDIFKFDALKSSHPVSVPINHANDISQIFDAISYSKGSCVLRMMQNFMGEEAFRLGVSNYLKSHAYGNAEQDNLWDSLTTTSHSLKTIPNELTVKKIMDSWTLQTGYPIVTVVRDYNTGSAALTQNRYLLDMNTARNSYENCWYIPLSYTTPNELDFNNTKPKKWLECNDKEVIPITIDNLARSDEWVIFNIQLSGLYKVKYDEKNWDLLIDALMSPDFHKIHVMNRAQLIDDALDLAWTGDQDYDIAMRIIEYLSQEREYIPWMAALSNLNAVNRILRFTPEYEFFKRYIRKIIEPIYEAVGGLDADRTNSERLDSVKRQVLITGWACRFEVSDCVERATDYFKQWELEENPDEKNPIPLNLRSVVYCAAVRNGNDREWAFLWQRYAKSNVAAEKQTILSSLGCSREIWLLQRYLEWSFNETSGIRKQDSFTVFGAVARSEFGFHLAKDYFLENLPTIYKYYSPDSSKISRLLKPIAAQMNSYRDYELIKNFTETNKQYFDKSTEGVKRAIETIEINSQWKTRNYNDINRHLRKYL